MTIRVISGQAAKVKATAAVNVMRWISRSGRDGSGSEASTGDAEGSDFMVRAPFRTGPAGGLGGRRGRDATHDVH